MEYCETEKKKEKKREKSSSKEVSEEFVLATQVNRNEGQHVSHSWTIKVFDMEAVQAHTVASKQL